MFYVAYTSREGRHHLAEFPDAPGCQTFAASAQALASAAREALEGWLEAHLADGQSPPRPRVHARAPAGRRLLQVAVDPGLSAALQLRWARQDAGLSQKQLAEKAGVSQQQIAKLENPDENPTLGTLSKVSEALGMPLTVSFGTIAEPTASWPARKNTGGTRGRR